MLDWTCEPMPKRKHSNTDELRAEFARQLSEAIKGISKNLAAKKLGISRQMLRLYLKGMATPGGEVIKKACDEWSLTLSIKGFQFTGDAFASNAKPRGRQDKLSEPSLFDLLDKLEKNQIEAEVVGREGDSFYLRFRIKLAA
ncbi:MAG: helix-turn-helix transcriptional regulator [Terracidiphilus sp.]|jgi:transcriptional regulator with XRE-family HTH domain